MLHRYSPWPMPSPPESEGQSQFTARSHVHFGGPARPTTWSSLTLCCSVSLWGCSNTLWHSRAVVVAQLLNALSSGLTASSGIPVFSILFNKYLWSLFRVPGTRDIAVNRHTAAPWLRNNFPSGRRAWVNMRDHPVVTAL